MVDLPKRFGDLWRRQWKVVAVFFSGPIWKVVEEAGNVDFLAHNISRWGGTVIGLISQWGWSLSIPAGIGFFVWTEKRRRPDQPHLLVSDTAYATEKVSVQALSSDLPVDDRSVVLFREYGRPAYGAVLRLMKDAEDKCFAIGGWPGTAAHFSKYYARPVFESAAENVDVAIAHDSAPEFSLAFRHFYGEYGSLMAKAWGFFKTKEIILDRTLLAAWVAADKVFVKEFRERVSAKGDQRELKMTLDTQSPEGRDLLAGLVSDPPTPGSHTNPIVPDISVRISPWGADAARIATGNVLIDLQVVADDDVLVEVVEMEIAGMIATADWRSDYFGSIPTILMGVGFEPPKPISSGPHTVRFRAFSGGKWWAWREFELDFEPLIRQPDPTKDGSSQ